MSRKYKIWDQDKLYFVTFTVVEWIDVFTNQVYRDIFLDSLRFSLQNKGLDLCAYCIMSNHVHLIIGRNGEITIEDLIRDIKKYTSKNIIEAINQSSAENRKALLLERFGKAGRKNLNNTNFQFWQQHSHPIELNTNDKINRCLNYINQNPVKAGIVCLPEEYLYSSAKNYAGLPDKLIDVILID